MIGYRRVLVTPELVAQFLCEGRVQASLRVDVGLPEGARLFSVEYLRRPGGVEGTNGEITLTFEHESWEPDPLVPVLPIRFSTVRA